MLKGLKRLSERIKKAFEECKHENIQYQLGEQKRVKEVTIWEKDNPEPLDNYYILRCPDCRRLIKYQIEW